MTQAFSGADITGEECKRIERKSTNLRNQHYRLSRRVIAALLRSAAELLVRSFRLAYIFFSGIQEHLYTCLLRQ